ncbi:DUF4214 domain-containing protein [Mesorhizobium sp. CAU 1741]|uniref:DUF4214 domain-containing protein n=1 Tax=Mesorhizobium sp. CAU 1741 TaxID=3140366 RepID=UPI00325B1341
MATIQGIYLALFGRPADPAGLAFWEAETNGGTDLSAMIGALTGTDEFIGRFGEDASPSVVVTAIYQSLFNRDPDPEGLAFFLEQLESGAQTIESIAVNVLDGAQAADLDTVNAKIAAANLFTERLDLDEEVEAYVGDDAAQVGRDYIESIDTANLGTEGNADVAILELFPDEGQNPGGGGGGGGGAGNTQAPVALDVSFGEIGAGVDVFASAADLVGSFATDADSNLSASSLTFLTASVGGVEMNLADAGFSFTAGSGDAGGLGLTTEGIAAFAGLADGEIISVEVTFEVSDGTFSDIGTLSYQVVGGSLDYDVALDVGGSGAGSRSTSATAEEGETEMGVAVGGAISLADAFGAIDFTEAAADSYAALVDIDGLNLAIAVAEDDSAATATATNQSTAIAEATNLSDATAAAVAASKATATASHNSISSAQASDNSEASATASADSTAETVSVDASDSTAVGLNDADAFAGSAGSSSSTATAEGGEAGHSDASAISFDNSTATATAEGNSDATALGTESSEAIAFATIDSSAAASADAASVANAVAGDDSRATANASEESDGLAFADDSSVANASGTNGSSASATAEGSSSAAVSSDGNSTATASASDGSAADAQATDESVASAEATESSVSTAVADDLSATSANALDSSAATAFAAGESAADATASNSSVSSAVAYLQAVARAFSSGNSDALAVAQQGSAEATSNVSSSASSAAGNGANAKSTADTSSTAVSVAAHDGDVVADFHAVSDAADSSVALALSLDGALAEALAENGSAARAASDLGAILIDISGNQAHSSETTGGETWEFIGDDGYDLKLLIAEITGHVTVSKAVLSDVAMNAITEYENGVSGLSDYRPVVERFFTDPDEEQIITVGVNDPEVVEGEILTFTLTRDDSDLSPITVSFLRFGDAEAAIYNPSPNEGDDYTGPRNVSFPSGQTSATVAFQTLVDALDEGTESVVIYPYMIGTELIGIGLGSIATGYITEA